VGCTTSVVVGLLFVDRPLIVAAIALSFVNWAVDGAALVGGGFRVGAGLIGEAGCFDIAAVSAGVGISSTAMGKPSSKRESVVLK